MNEIIFLIEEAPEGGYTARALGESVFKESEILDELKKSIKEVVDCHFDDDKTRNPLAPLWLGSPPTTNWWNKNFISTQLLKKK